MKVLEINLNKSTSKEKEYPYQGVLGLGINLHLEAETYNYSPTEPENILVFGTGPFNFGGTHRGIFIFRSPLHGGLHSSTLGDLGSYLKKAGYQAVVIKGEVSEPSFLMIKNGEIKLLKREFSEDIFNQAENLDKKMKNWYGEGNFRLCLTSKLARFLPYGAIISPHPQRIKEDFSASGRGGAGSVMAQAHGLVGIAIGGDNPVDVDPFPTDTKDILAKTEKYRDTGTFNSNFSNFEKELIMFNWASFDYQVEKRKQFHKKFILNQFLNNLDFKRETCGEHCLAACRKLERGQRVDYEPFEGVGPFLGIFDRELVRNLDYLVDALSVDAIYIGHVLGMLMEAAAKETIDLSERFGIEQTPVWGLEAFEKKDSKRNYEVALQLMERLPTNPLFRQKVSSLAQELGIKDSAFYMNYNSDFDMVPNFYWSLGLILPIVMPGKYFSDYSSQVSPPEEYGRLCAEKTRQEFILDDLGICRFHRKWLDLEELVSEKYFQQVDENIKEIASYRRKAGAEQKFWESSKLKQAIKKLIQEDDKDYDLKSYWQQWEKSYNQKLDLG